MSKSRIAGWILTILVAAVLIVLSAGGKFLEWDGKDEAFGKLGWTTDAMFRVGILEVALAVLFLIPRTAFVGTVGLTAYLGGAVATHARIGDNFASPVIVGVLAWIALGLRDPRVLRLALQTGIGKRSHGNLHEGELP